jgi:hypothetical protein
MNPETIERLSKELQEPEGFSSYKEGNCSPQLRCGIANDISDSYALEL